VRILIVEDDERLSEALTEVLEEACYAVDAALDGSTAEELAAVNEYDLVLLDLTIPPPTGLELLARWRRQGSQTPVLILTAQGSVPERVEGLDAGADDYLVKPFAYDELLARVRSIFRRRRGSELVPLTAGDLEMHRESRQVLLAGQELDLSPKEFALLEYLLVNQDRVVTRQQISEHVWDSAFDSLSNIINVFVYRLRKKVDGNSNVRLIHTVKDQGYVLRSQRS
jgi:DNA-binding response OmpR family regulator